MAFCLSLSLPSIFNGEGEIYVSIDWLFHRFFAMKKDRMCACWHFRVLSPLCLLNNKLITFPTRNETKIKLKLALFLLAFHTHSQGFQ
jgi:hypothetical protein